MLQRMKEAESGAESEKIKEEFEAKFSQMNVEQVCCGYSLRLLL